MDAQSYVSQFYIKDHRHISLIYLQTITTQNSKILDNVTHSLCHAEINMKCPDNNNGDTSKVHSVFRKLIILHSGRPSLQAIINKIKICF